MAAFHDGPDRPPWLVYLFFALIVVGPVAVARWSSLDELLADRRTPAELLISQTARWLGCVFLAVVHTDPPTSVFTQWPMVLFPAYPVPFSITLHVTTIRQVVSVRLRCP